MRKIDFMPVDRTETDPPGLWWNRQTMDKWVSMDHTWYILHEEQVYCKDERFIRREEVFTAIRVDKTFEGLRSSFLGQFPSWVQADAAIRRFIRSGQEQVEKSLEEMMPTTPTLRRKIFL